MQLQSFKIKYILVLISLIFSAIFILVVSNNSTFIQIDTEITIAIYKTFAQHDGFVYVFLLITYATLASPLPLIFILIYDIYNKQYKQLIILSIFTLIAFLSEDFIKNAVHKERIFINNPAILNISKDLSLANEYSFPSGHSTFAFFFATFISIRLVGKNRGKFQYILFVIAFSVALSRVALGVHYVSDTIAGALLGSVIAIISLVVEKPNVIKT